MDAFDEEEEEKQRLINWQFTKEVAYQMCLHDTLSISNTRDSLLLDNAKERTVVLLEEKHNIIISTKDIEIPQYLAMFHFARTGKDGEGIEFAHKTVYEYFTAVKLYEDYFAYINSDYPEPDNYESLEKVWTNIIEAFRYKSFKNEIFDYLKNMELPAYNGKAQEDSKKKFDYKKFERHYIEGMKQHILADVPVKSRLKEYIVNNELLTTQICCAFRNLTWLLTGHGYYNEDDNMACKRFKELCSIYCGSLNLKKWKLSRADLSGAELNLANLSGADLREAELFEADLRSASYCLDIRCKTKFPEDFDPKEHGMIEVDILGNLV